ncbi:MAG: ATP-binding protein [Pseudomonadota bacterium]
MVKSKKLAFANLVLFGLLGLIFATALVHFERSERSIPVAVDIDSLVNQLVAASDRAGAQSIPPEPITRILSQHQRYFTRSPKLRGALADLFATVERARELGRKAHPDDLRHHAKDIVHALGQTRSDTRWRTVLLMTSLIAIGAVVLGISLWLGRRNTTEALTTPIPVATEMFLQARAGVFLLNDAQVVSPEHSRELAVLFRRDDLAGLSFANLLDPILPADRVRDAQSFVSALWQGDLTGERIEKNNPLHSVEVYFQEGDIGFDVRHFQFDFRPVHIEGIGRQVLVTVVDVPNAPASAELATDADMVFEILNIEISILERFFRRAEALLDTSNEILRRPQTDEAALATKVVDLLRAVRQIKSEADVLSIPSIERPARELERLLKALSKKKAMTGHAFLPVTVRLNHLYQRMDSLQRIGERITAAEREDGLAQTISTDVRALFGDSPPILDDNDDDTVVMSPTEEAEDSRQAEVTNVTTTLTMSQLVDTLAHSVARNQGKQIDVAVQGLDRVPPSYEARIKEICFQLVQNAVTHGIEEPAMRESHGKHPTGHLRLSFSSNRDGSFKLECFDDGKGLNADDIRTNAVKRGVVTAEAAQAMTKAEVLGLIFHPVFSEADDDGESRGLDVVRTLVSETRGKIKVGSKPNRRTRIVVHFPAVRKAA